MTKRVQRFGQAAALGASFVGLAREIIVDTTNQSLRVHDGTTPGGFQTARADAVNLQPATAAQDGKMLAADFVALQGAIADILTLEAEVAGNDARLDVLEPIVSANQVSVAQLLVDVATAQATADAAIVKIPTPIVGSLVTVAAGGNLAQNALTKDNIAQIPLNTVVVFLQAAAPLGWTLDVTHNDRVFRINNTVGGGVGGTWTISGISVDGHALTAEENGLHIHRQRAGLAEPPGGDVSASYPPGGGGVPGPVQWSVSGTENNPTALNTESSGSGTPHAHGLTIGSSWRPLYVDGIACKRAANP